MDLGKQTNQLCSIEAILNERGETSSLHGIFENEQSYYSSDIMESEVDYVSCRLRGEVEFICFTVGLSEQELSSRGLSPLDGLESVLGAGIYAVPKNDWFAFCSLRELIFNQFEGYTILKVEGKYTGDYLKCLEGEIFQGVLVLKSDIPINSIETISELAVESVL